LATTPLNQPSPSTARTRRPPLETEAQAVSRALRMESRGSERRMALVSGVWCGVTATRQPEPFKRRGEGVYRDYRPSAESPGPGHADAFCFGILDVCILYSSIYL
jgi:hypothetical protein